MDIHQQFSLQKYTTFGVAVKTKYFTEITSVESLVEAIQFAKNNHLKILFLGGGSNVLFTKDFDGLVILMNIKGIEHHEIDENKIIVTAKAGENWHEFVHYCTKKNWGGLENLSLIPGNVGTSPIQNIGAYGTEIKDHFYSCKALDIERLEWVDLSNVECKFGYRDSIFKNEAKGKYVIVEVAFLLTKKNHEIKKQYGAIQEELDKNKIENPNIQDIANAVVTIRKTKLPDPKIIGNAGSFFKNPTVPLSHFELLKKAHVDLPGYPQNEGVKVPAGWLIEQCGWKGKQIENVATHHLQALVIVNKTGMATGQEIYDFSGKIIDSVQKKFEITLEREVNIY